MNGLASIDFVVAGWHSAGVVQSEPRSHESDGHGIDADVYPSLVGDTEVEVEGEAEQEAPSGHGALTATEAWVVESRPSIIDEQSFAPFGHGMTLVHGSSSEGDEGNTASDEDGVAEYFLVETVLCVAESRVGCFKGQQTSPRDVVGWVCHAEHVQSSKNQSPDAKEDQSRGINGHLAIRGLAGFIVAHVLADWRTAFKHTERSDP